MGNAKTHFKRAREKYFQEYFPLEFEMATTSTIRKATESDLAAIGVWLRAERAQTGGGFYCNWNIIEETFQQDFLSVLAVDEDIVGFVADKNTGPNIVEVRPDARGNGYGQQLAEYAMREAFARGNSVIEGECAPESSVPFWEKMGFTVVLTRVGLGGGVYAYRILDRKFELGAGLRVPFEVGFYPKDRDWNRDTKPFKIYAGASEQLADGSLQLPERAICFDPAISNLADCVVRIAVRDMCLFEDKVKRDEAEAMGICHDAGYNYYIDRIFQPDLHPPLEGGSKNF